MAPPEHTACLGAASVLSPTPTILSSRVHVNHEPACRSVGREKGDEVEEKDKGKGRDGDDSDEDGEEDVPVVCFGPLKGRPGSGHVKSVTRHGDLDADASFASTLDSNKYIFVAIIIFFDFFFSF